MLIALLVPALAKEFAPLTIASGLAEQYTVCRWNMEDGLPENSLQALCFTSDGFLWCVSEHRLVRFDGLHFTTPPTPPVTSEHDTWLGATEDTAGRLWLYGLAGAFRLDGWTWTPFWKKPTVALATPIIWMKTTTNGVVWAATPTGLWRLEGDALREFPLPVDKSATMKIHAVAADARGQFWLATNRRLLRFANGVFTEEALPPECRTLEFRHLAIGRDGTVWVASSESLCCKRQDRWEQVPVPDRADDEALGITQLFAAPDGALWVGTERALYYVRYGLWPEALQNAQSPIRNVRWIGVAPDGSLWLAGGDGLRQLRRRFIRTYRAEEPLRQAAITALAVDTQGKVLAGVADVGLMQVQPAGDLAIFPRPGLPSRLQISALAAAHDGSLWIGTPGEGLWRCHAESVELIRQPDNMAGVKVNITALLEDHRGQIFVGTDAGLKVVAPKLDAVVNFTNASGQSCTHRINALLEDRTGRIWIGTQFDGLWQMATNGAFERCLSAGTILALHADRDGGVWVGTPAGLEHWLGTQRATLLRGEYVAQILDDNLGHLWLGLQRGLARISKAELAAAAQNSEERLNLRFFGVSEGFPAAACASGAGQLGMKTPDGRLWFATRDGLAMVDPWKVPEPPAESLRICLDEVLAGDRAVWSRNLSAGGSAALHLPPGAHDFEFRFTAPCFSTPETVRFVWRLDGFDGDWTEPSAERHANYPQLPPGQYQLHVRAGLNGAWSPDVTLARLVVAPFFWQTWWWRLLLFAAGTTVVVLVALGIYRWRMNRQQQLDRLRLRIARDLHDEIGSNLGGIALLLGMAGTAAGAEAVQRIRSITEQSIEALKDLVWMIDPVHDSLGELVQRIRDVAENLLQGIAHEIKVEGNIWQVQAPIEVRRNILPIFKEALHNIIKHARAREVEIVLTLKDNILKLSIHDDGAGMDPAAARGGHGLRNMQRRAEEIGGHLSIQSQPGTGTVISLEVALR